jgi:hypothetical protein
MASDGERSAGPSVVAGHSVFEAREGAVGEIYVMYFYQGGEKQFRIIPKAMFDKAKADFVTSH